MKTLLIVYLGVPNIGLDCRDGLELVFVLVLVSVLMRVPVQIWVPVLKNSWASDCGSNDLCALVLESSRASARNSTKLRIHCDDLGPRVIIVG